MFFSARAQGARANQVACDCGERVHGSAAPYFFFIFILFSVVLNSLRARPLSRSRISLGCGVVAQRKKKTKNEFERIMRNRRRRARAYIGTIGRGTTECLCVCLRERERRSRERKENGTVQFSKSVNSKSVVLEHF